LEVQLSCQGKPVSKYILLAVVLGVIPITSPLYAPALMALTLAVVSGMWVLHKHAKVFYDFNLRELLAGRLDAILYVLVSSSTAMCTIDLAAQLHSLLADETAIVSLFCQRSITLGLVHSGFGSISLALHLVVSKLLSNDVFCSLCRRPL